MKKSYSIMTLVSASLLLQACNAGPETPRPIAHTPQASSSPKPMNNSFTARDSQYVSLLQELSQRNPQQEAQQALTRGENSLMAYYAGRAGLNIPGLSAEQQAAQRCPLKTLDGLGDVIYGENHLKYRVALRKFAMQYNMAMKPACL